MTVSSFLVENFGYLSPKEHMAMIELGQHVPDGGTFVNIGVGVGTSSLTVAEVNPNIKIYSVDIDAQNLITERDNFGRAGLTPPLQLIGDSGEIGWHWRGGPIDFLFIDGDHAESGLTRDMIAWLQYVPNNGIVAFHDYKSKYWGAITALIDQSMKFHEKFFEIDTLIGFRIVRG
jgi:predicted O-methyltransferase YrrM